MLYLQRRLHRVGTPVIGRLSHLPATDPVSGFRTLFRQAVRKMNVFSRFGNTTEMVVQKGRLEIAPVGSPARTNFRNRKSRLLRGAGKIEVGAGGYK